MTGSKCYFVVDQSEDNGAIHKDAHMFFRKTQEENYDTITDIMTQLSFNTGLK